METGIEKLNSTNYFSWVEDIKVTLLDKGCWNFVTGKEPPLEAGVTLKERRDYELRRDRAYSTIYLSVDKDYRTLITHTEDCSVAWEILKKHFRPNTRARTISLLDSFFNCRYVEGEVVGIYGARLRSIVTQLSEAGHPLADIYQAFQLLRYMPSDFQEPHILLFRRPLQGPAPTQEEQARNDMSD